MHNTYMALHLTARRYASQRQVSLVVNGEGPGIDRSFENLSFFSISFHQFRMFNELLGNFALPKYGRKTIFCSGLGFLAAEKYEPITVLISPPASLETQRSQRE